MTPSPTSSGPNADLLDVPTVSVDSVLEQREALILDLRSPGEFADDHLPGAHSVPLFDDVERAMVGTLYKQHSPQAAFDKGREFARDNIDRIVGQIAELAGWDVETSGHAERVLSLTAGGIAELSKAIHARDVPLPSRPVVLHCWRGGLRSKSVIAFVRALGLDRAVGLEGGYKAYRKFVLAQTQQWHAPRSYVVRGLTGVGKTLILRELEKLRPGWTLDLEACAGHRSSLLGMVGLEPCTQKTFESRIAERLRSGFPDVVVYEGESRKVGDAIVPESVWKSLTKGANLLVTASVERRIQVLKDDYLATAEGARDLPAQLEKIDARMNNEFGLADRFREGRIDELVEILLEHYYDPLYRHSETGRTYAAKFESQDEQKTAQEIAHFIERDRKKDDA